MQTLKKEKIKQVASIFIAAIMLAVIGFGIANFSAANSTDFASMNLLPSASHLFGTDNLGRDVFALTISGITISVLTGILSSLISAIIAVLIAILYATNSTVLTKVIDLLTNMFLGIPHIILMILISFAVGKGFFGVVLATSLTHWPTLSRVLSAELRQLKTQNWVQIEKSQGIKGLRLALDHYVPNLLPQIITGLTLAIPHAILHESTLTFLGMGFSPETPAIGNILNDSLKFALTGQWWLAIAPGIALILCTLAISYIFNNAKHRQELR